MSDLRGGRLQENQVRGTYWPSFGTTSILSDRKVVMSSQKMDIQVWEESINSGVVSIEIVFKVPNSTFWDTDSVTMYINLILRTCITGSMMPI